MSRPRRSPLFVLAVTLLVGALLVPPTSPVAAQTSVPTLRTPSTELVDITTGGSHSCGLTASGTAWCWGSDSSGQLGNGGASSADQTTPTRVNGGELPNGTAFVSIDAGDLHTCGVATSGAAYCWGANSGRLGNGSTATPTATSPVRVAGGDLAEGDTFASVTSGHDHSCGATTAGAILCWGSDSDSQLGDGPQDTIQRSTPTAVDGSSIAPGSVFTQVDAGDYHTCGLTGDGVVYCWGVNSSGQVGDGNDDSQDVAAPVPVLVTGLAGSGTFSAISAGGNHTCGLTVDRRAYCWGRGRLGRLGDGGPQTDARAPVLVDQSALPDGQVFVELSAGAEHTCAVTDGGTGWCWGGARLGRLGTGLDDDIDQTTPVPVEDSAFPPGTSVANVAAGDRHSCVLLEDGSAACWGLTDEGRLGHGPEDERVRLAPVMVDGPPPPEIGTPTEAAILLSTERYTPIGDRSPNHVVLSRDDLFADSLTGSVLSGDGPLLFTNSASLNPPVGEEIDRLLGGTGTVYLLGGTAALSDDVAQGLRDRGYEPIRLAGPSRIETAVAIAEEAERIYGPAVAVALARAGGPESNPTAAWADAIGAGALAALTSNPILLTPTDSLHPATAAWLADHPTAERVVLGGTAAVTESTASQATGAAEARRVSGSNRWSTAAAVATELWPTEPASYVIAPGNTEDGWAYGLASAGLGADTNAPLLLTDLDALPSETDTQTCITGSRSATRLLTPTAFTSAQVVDALLAPCP